MKIAYTLSESDVVAFTQHHANHSREIQRQWRNARLGWAAFYIVLGLLSAMMLSLPIVGISGIIPALIWVVVLPKYLRRRLRAQVVKMYREGTNRTLYGKHELRAEEGELETRSQSSEGKVNWSGIEKVESTTDHTFIYLSAMTAIIVPRHSVTEGDYDEFTKTVRLKRQGVTV